MPSMTPEDDRGTAFNMDFKVSKATICPVSYG